MEQNDTYTYNTNTSEPLFISGTTAPDKIAHEFAESIISQTYRQKMRKGIIIALILWAVTVVLIIFPVTNDIGEMLFGLVGVYLIATMVRLLSQQKSIIKKHTEDKAPLPVFAFYDDRIERRRENGEISDLPYSTVLPYIESENLFLLPVENEGTIAVDKRTSDIDLPAFRAFLSDKNTLERSEGSIFSKKRVTEYILILVLFIALGFGAHFLCQKQLDAPKVITQGEYSITLTKRFEKQKKTDYFDIYYDGKDVCASFYEKISLDDYISDITLSEVYENEREYAKDAGYSLNMKIVGTDIDSLQYEYYTKLSDGGEIYCYVSLNKTEKSIYYTEFYCDAKKADKYKPLFEKWAGSIECARKL